MSGKLHTTLQHARSLACLIQTASLVYAKERNVAIQAVLTASKVCQSVFQHLVANETLTKNDKSPVTGNLQQAYIHTHTRQDRVFTALHPRLVADFSAQAIVNTYLKDHFPQDPIVGEEDSKDLQGDEGKPLREKVFSLTNGVLSDSEKLSEQQVSRCGVEEKRKVSLKPRTG